MYKYILLKY